jgi:hypothetical protein
MRGRQAQQIAREARAELDYCALFIVGPVEPLPLFSGRNRPLLPVTFGVSSNPRSQVTVARRWNFAHVEIRHEWWTVGRPLAERLERRVLAFCESGGFRLALPGLDGGDRWFDMDWPGIEQAVAWCSCVEGIETMSAAERDERHARVARHVVARREMGFMR